MMDFPQVIQLLDKHFGTSAYSLRSLFREEQHKVLDRVLEATLTEIEVVYRDLYERHYPPMRSLTSLGYPIPKAFHSAAELILNIDLRRAFSNDKLDMDSIKNYLEEAKSWKVDLDTEGLGYVLEQTLEEMIARFASTPEDISLLKELAVAVALARSVPLAVDLSKVQNLYYEIM